MDLIFNRVKAVRESWGLSQIEFAKRLGVTNAHISAIEKGKSFPSESLIKLICKEYKISELWLKNNEGPMLQEDVDIEAEDTIIEMFDTDLYTNVGLNIAKESNRVRISWAQMELYHRNILAQKCSDEEERFEYFKLCEELFKDISNAISSFRSGESHRLTMQVEEKKYEYLPLIYKDRIIKDMDQIKMYIDTHKPKKFE